MKVILTKDVENVGKQGDVTNVAEGFARNFLFPRKLAIEASKGNLRNIEKQHQIEEHIKEQRLGSAQGAAGKLEGKTVTIQAKTGSGTKLYGSITSHDIADAIREMCGLEVDKRKITLAKPIRSTGTYQVPVQLHRDVVVRLNVDVVAASGEQH